MTPKNAPSKPEAAPARTAQRRQWVPRLVAFITYLSGFLNIASAISPGFKRSRLHNVFGGHVPAEV